MSRRRDPRSAMRLPTAIGGDIARAVPARLAPVRRISAVWEQAVGAALARVAQPARVARDGTLVVHAADASWVHALTLEQRTILRRLGELLPDGAPAALRAEVGPISVGEAVEETPETPIRPEALERAEALTEGVADAGLREVLSRAVAKSLSRSKSL